jgi:hypothetical protein
MKWGGERAMQDAEQTQWVLIARMALRVARRCVSTYACVKSRHDFTQPQLLTCLVLKHATKNDYRGICQLLTLAPALRQAMGLETVPHWTTLQKFMAKADVPRIVDRMIGQILAEVGLNQRSTEIAVDSTGLQNGLASVHYQSRRWAAGNHRVRKSVKVSVAVICGALLPAALVVDLGTSSDMRQMPALMEQIEIRTKPSHLLADAGYDAEWVHEVCRERWQAQSVIPAVIRTQDGSIKTKYRALMRALPSIYGRRWHAESYFSALKRTTLATLSSRSERMLLAEASLKVLAYAIRR